MRHRPIGIGIQGLADVFFMLNIAFHSEEAIVINRLIFETIYHAALCESNLISTERSDLLKNLKTARYDDVVASISAFNMDNFYLTNEEYTNLHTHPEMIGSYSSFVGSPLSKGIFQFDMWNVTPTPGRYDWETLRSNIIKHGLRNSLLVAPMPTASTSQILGNNECFEPITSNIYTRRTLAGEFVMINKYLIRELIDLGIWNEKIKNNIIDKYKTVWEIPMKHLIDMAADRGAFICQSQSLNLWLEEPNYNTMTSMHFYSWTKGLKTGIYYLRRKPKHQVQQFTIEPEKNVNSEKEITDNENTCEMCSS